MLLSNIFVVLLLLIFIVFSIGRCACSQILRKSHCSESLSGNGSFLPAVSLLPRSQKQRIGMRLKRK